jgi:hypothetical protein
MSLRCVLIGMNEPVVIGVRGAQAQAATVPNEPAAPAAG